MKKLGVIAAFAIMLCFLTACANKADSLYSFSGENEAFTISNGMIIITKNMEQFIGGDITFKSEELRGIQTYNTRFDYHKNGERVSLLSNGVSIQGSDEGIEIQADLGSSSSTSLFAGNDLERIAQSLDFTLTGTFLTGETFEYTAKLDVKKEY